MTSMRSRSFSSKRIKLEDEAEDLLPTHDDLEGVEPNQDDSENSCSICLHSIVDRTVIPKCSHEFCFECLLVWTGMSNYLFFIREMVKMSPIYLKNNPAGARYVHKPLESIWYTPLDRGTTIESIFYLPYGHHHPLLVQRKRMPFCKPPARDDDESVNGGHEQVSQTRQISWKGQLLNDGGFIDMISMRKYVWVCFVLLCSLC